MSNRKVNALRAFAGTVVAVGSAIRAERLNEARRDQRDAEKDVDTARSGFDAYINTTAPDPIVALRKQQAINDAQNDLNEVQRDVDGIQDEEALYMAGVGAAMAADGLGIGNGGGDGGGGGGSGNGDGGGGGGGEDLLDLVVPAAAGFAGGALANTMLSDGRRSDRR